MSIKKRILKVVLALFVSIFLVIGILLPHRCRMKYANTLIKIRNIINGVLGSG